MRKKREHQMQDRGNRLVELGKKMFRSTGNKEVERTLEMFRRGDINTNDFEEQMIRLQEKLGVEMPNE
jgi:hypothetical protein